MDNDELMDAAARTPPPEDQAFNNEAVNPVEEPLGQEAISGGVRRSVSRRGSLQLNKPRLNALMRRAGVTHVPKLKKPKAGSMFFGDLRRRPKGI